MPFAIGVPLHHDAAASLDILTREPPRLIAEHKCHNIRDVLRRSYSIERRHLRGHVAECIGQPCRLRESRRHCIDCDTLGGEFMGQPFGENQWNY